MTPTTDHPRGASVSPPAKLVIERRVRPGREREFEVWVRALIHSASAANAHEGSSVLDAGGGEYFVLVRFASPEALDRWRESDEVVALSADGDTLSTAVDWPIVRSGLETWFTAPGHRSRVAPRWKMALVTWCALMPQVLLLSVVMPEGIPLVLGVGLTTAISVSMLTWVVMPRLTALLAGWLFSPDQEGARAVRA
ncbi:antibiotic biosynthesis monooxygenase [Gemmatimonas groenlandica]|uniref:Antibiotic biosynthesis monooxygenase n=1 Tax=Gemmatimonas groenlandica TaxID=2732249 RepID=A0A6M4IHI9_9BACT|nr:antibiotic biosynthesis monooxygenase [Gemmatimonas groenlandica]QJR34050.1 antibiotic biosynthesis monooxygenase [Gemmatimonas groenlandica]